MKKCILCIVTILFTISTLAQNRMYMGAYTSDHYYKNGYGMTDSPGTYSIVTDVPCSLLGSYDGSKIVGMRFALSETTQTTKCFILKCNGSKEDTLAVAHIKSAKAGWNEVTFDKSVTFNPNEYNAIRMGYEYVQTSSNKPIAYTYLGDICMAYYKKQKSNSYVSLGFDEIYCNICVQAIVEKAFAKNSVSIIDETFDDVYMKTGGKGNTTITLVNHGSNGVSSIDYTVTQDGVNGKEQHHVFSPAVTEFNKKFEMEVPFESISAGTKNTIITINKVNGAVNESDNKTVTGQVIVVKQPFTHRLAVEELTGTGCGYCIRGIQGMENLRNDFGDSFIGIALHQYSGSSRDAMALASSSYKALEFVEGAPICKIERGDEIDPYFGSENDIRDDFKKALEVVAPVGVEVSGYWNADKTAVIANATIESLASNKSYDIEYVLVADGLTGSEQNWKQSNYLFNFAPSTLPGELKKYGKGGEYGSETISGIVFNDVAIASSFVNGENQAESLGTLTANDPVSSSCTIQMPSSKTLLDAIKYDKVYIVALVVNNTTGRIVNAAKSIIDNDASTGIEDVAIPESNNSSSIIYNLAGQPVDSSYRGIVIKNGKKYMQK